MGRQTQNKAFFIVYLINLSKDISVLDPKYLLENNELSTTGWYKFSDVVVLIHDDDFLI